jgi:hypothetical protein
VADPPRDAVAVHGVQEEYFWLMVHPCGCGGAWFPRGQRLEESGDALVHAVDGTCASCGRRETFRFLLPNSAPADGPQAVREINPTAEPSRAVDLAEWMDLAQFYLERIGRLKDKVRQGQSLLDARLCLEEALKFYGPGEEDPPAGGLWSEASRRKAAARPEAFRRATLEKMLARLPPKERLRKIDGPVQQEFEAAVKEAALRRTGRWWQFWKRGWFLRRKGGR